MEMGHSLLPQEWAAQLSQRVGTEAEVGFKISVGPLLLFSGTSFGEVPGLSLLPSLRSCVCLCACDYKHVCTCGCMCMPLCVCLWNTSVHPEVPCSAPNSLSQWVFLKAWSLSLAGTVSSSCWNTLSPPDTFGVFAISPSWDISVILQYYGVCLNITGGSNFFSNPAMLLSWYGDHASLWTCPRRWCWFCLESLTPSSSPDQFLFILSSSFSSVWAPLQCSSRGIFPSLWTTTYSCSGRPLSDSNGGYFPTANYIGIHMNSALPGLCKVYMP